MWRTALKSSYSSAVEEAYKSIHQTLSYESGKFTLDQDDNFSCSYRRGHKNSDEATVIEFFLIDTE